MSNEVKIGILATVAIALSYWGYKFILGSNVLKDSNIYYIYYRDVAGLQIGTNVTINGVPVGSVANVELLVDKAETVKVTIDMAEKIKVPKDAVAVISPAGIMGGTNMTLKYSTPCSGEDCAKSGDELKGEVLGMMATMLGTDNIDLLSDEITAGLTDALDGMIGESSNTPLALSIRNLNTTMTNLSQASGQLDRLMSQSSGKINASLKNVEALTAAIAGKKQQLEAILDNTAQVSGQIAAADLQKTIEELNQTIAALKQTLGTADQTFSGVNSVISGIQTGEGTLGKLFADESLYDKLEAASTSLDSLLGDVQDKPWRYIPLKSRRKVEKYDQQEVKQ